MEKIKVGEYLVYTKEEEERNSTENLLAGLLANLTVGEINKNEVYITDKTGGRIIRVRSFDGKYLIAPVNHFRQATEKDLKEYQIKKMFKQNI